MAHRTSSPPVAVGASIVLAAAAVLVASVWQSSQPRLPGRIEADVTTIAVGALLTLLATGAALVVLSRLLEVVAYGRRPARELGLSLAGSERAAIGSAGRWAAGWGLLSLIAAPFSAATSAGVSVSYLVYAPGDFFAATQSSQAWLLTAGLALTVALAARYLTTWRAAAAAAVVTVLAGLPPVLTGQVSVGAGHDLATDAAMIMTGAVSVWFGLTLALGRVEPDQPRLARYRRVAGVALGLALLSRLIIGGFELAGEPPWQSGYGVVAFAGLALLIMIGLGWVVRLRGGTVAPQLDRVLMIMVLGVQAALTALIPPRYWRPQTAQENYLGFSLEQPPELSALLTPGRPNLLLITLAVAAISLYAWGFVRLRRRGDRWPIVRLVCWVLAWLIVMGVAGTEVWSYSSALFSWHMAVHMTLNMAVPVLLVLSGPITLLQRAGRAAAPDDLYRVRDAVTAALHWAPARVITHPLLVWAVFIGSFYALYFSPLFDSAMKFHWAHQLMMLHFLIIGCLFYGLAVGVDTPPRPIPHVAKLGFVFAAMPFHAFFAVAVLSGGAVIGQNFYSSLDLSWPVDLVADQQVGGQIAWATGELPLLIIIVALVGQWFRSDSRTAKRRDRARVGGHDDELDAYNEMLAELNRRRLSEQERR